MVFNLEQTLKDCIGIVFLKRIYGYTIRLLRYQYVNNMRPELFIIFSVTNVTALHQYNIIHANGHSPPQI